MKKKLEMTEGCTCWSYTADDKQFVDMSLEEQRSLIHEIIDNIDDPGLLQEVFRDYLQIYGDYESDGEPCECCGDIVETWSTEINVKDKEA